MTVVFFCTATALIDFLVVYTVYICVHTNLCIYWEEEICARIRSEG